MEKVNMKKAKYLKTLCCPMTEEMFLKVNQITEEKEISISEFLRDSIELKINSLEENISGRDETL